MRVSVNRIFVVLALLGTSPAAFAATVNVTSGPVSLNNGSGFKAVTQSAAANPGDIVTAGAGGGATIVYEDGCAQSVGAGESATVAPASPCTAGAPGAGAAGVGSTGLVVGALGVAAVVGGVVAISSSSDSPASP